MTIATPIADQPERPTCKSDFTLMEISSNRRFRPLGLSVVTAWLFVAHRASAQPSSPDSSHWSYSPIPFAYYSELFKTSAGILLRASHPSQGKSVDPCVVDFVAFCGQNGSWYLYHRIQGLTTPAGVVLEPTVLIGRFGEIRGYTDREPRSFPDREGERFPGHNQSIRMTS